MKRRSKAPGGDTSPSSEPSEAHHCPGCGYDVRAIDESSLCPECGRKIDRPLIEFWCESAAGTATVTAKKDLRSFMIVIAVIMFAFATAVFEMMWVTLPLVLIAMLGGIVWVIYLTFPPCGRLGTGYQFRATREGFAARRGVGDMPLTPWSDAQRVRVYGPLPKSLDKYACEIFTGQGFGKETVLHVTFRDVDKAIDFAERMADLIISEGGFDPAASTSEKPLLEAHRDGERDGRPVRIRSWR